MRCRVVLQLRARNRMLSWQRLRPQAVPRKWVHSVCKSCWHCVKPETFQIRSLRWANVKLSLCSGYEIVWPNVIPWILQDVKSEGPPHLKTFWVKCTVRPLNGSPIEVTESANQKKKAKNLSAASMLKMLQANGGAQSNLADLAKKVASNPDVSDNLVQRIVCKDKQRCSNLFSHSHHRFQNMFGQAMLALKEVSHRCSSFVSNFTIVMIKCFEFRSVRWQAYQSNPTSP